MKDPNRTSNGSLNGGKERERKEERSSKFYLKFTNEPKVLPKYVSSSLYGVEITFFCAIEDFHCNEITIIH